jgi:hypothetical protein
VSKTKTQTTFSSMASVTGGENRLMVPIMPGAPSANLGSY